MRIIELMQGNGLKSSIEDFILFACDELSLPSVPKITILDKPISNTPYNSFAAYKPDVKEIVLYAKNRHVLDTMRSLCHEMVHYRQDLAGELNQNSGVTGSDHENEANSIAGQIMRKYGKLHPELF